MRVLFEKNILVSALVVPGRRAEDALSRIIEGKDTIIVSRPLIRELLDVLARKFDRDAEELPRAAVFIAELGNLVEPKRKISVPGDETDKRVLECAVAGKADLIVTGDHEILELVEYEGVQIITLRDYLGMR